MYVGVQGSKFVLGGHVSIVSLDASCTADGLRLILSGMKVGYICIHLILVVLLALDLISNI